MYYFSPVKLRVNSVRSIVLQLIALYGVRNFHPSMKLKSSYTTSPTNGDVMLNEHMLERHAAAVRQLSNGTNGIHLCIYSNSREHCSGS